jgi:dihydroxyacetone kinase-like predicted kinase
MGVGIAWMGGPRPARPRLVVSDWVAAGREEINRIALRPLGGSPVGAAPDSMRHAHVHANTAVAVLTCVSRRGTLEKTDAEDRRARHREMRQPAPPHPGSAG